MPMGKRSGLPTHIAATAAKPPHPLSAGKSANVQGSLAQLEVMAMRVMQHLWSSLLGSEIKKIIPVPRRRRAWAYAPIAAVFMAVVAARSTTFADSATWVGGGDPDCRNCWG